MSEHPDRMYWGAGWIDSEQYARMWSRGGSAPAGCSSFIGFRLTVGTEGEQVNWGGGWDDSVLARVAYRYGDAPTSRDSSLGFRLARDGEDT